MLYSLLLNIPKDFNSMNQLEHKNLYEDVSFMGFEEYKKTVENDMVFCINSTSLNSIDILSQTLDFSDDFRFHNLDYYISFPVRDKKSVRVKVKKRSVSKPIPVID